MFNPVRKAWMGFLTPIIGFVGNAILDPNATPTDVVADPNMWLMAVATAFVVWAVPNTPS